MKRFLLIAFAATTLAGCTAALPDLGTMPAPLNATAVDDQVVAFGFESLDAVRALVDSRIDSGKLVPGSPKALEAAKHLRTAADAIRAFSAAQRAGSTHSALTALAEATRAVGIVKNLVR